MVEIFARVVLHKPSKVTTQISQLASCKADSSLVFISKVIHGLLILTYTLFANYWHMDFYTLYFAIIISIYMHLSFI